MAGLSAYLLPLVLAAIAANVLLAPLPFNVEVGPWESQPVPQRTGILAPNNVLDSCTNLGHVHGAETVVLGPDGRVYGATADGWIVAVDRKTGETERWVQVRGRPLGLEFDAAGDLIVAEALKGLLHVNSTSKRISILAHHADGKDINFADDVSIGQNGAIYFSDASSIPPVQNGFSYDALQGSVIDIISSQPRGRLLRYTENNGVETLLDQIHFANGVALSKGESFVLINETPRARVLRYWLKGPKAGTSDVFAEALPGLPDGISRRTDGSGHFWVALVSPRDPLLEAIAPYPFLRSLVLKLRLPVVGKPHGHIVELDEEGHIVRNLEGATESITAVAEIEGKLYLGHLHSPHITVCELPR